MYYNFVAYYKILCSTKLLKNIYFRNVNRLIQSCAEANKATYLQLEGITKGKFDSIQEADDYISIKSGKDSTESEFERLITIGQAAFRKQKQRESAPIKQVAKHTPPKNLPILPPPQNLLPILPP